MAESYLIEEAAGRPAPADIAGEVAIAAARASAALHTALVEEALRPRMEACGRVAAAATRAAYLTMIDWANPESPGMPLSLLTHLLTGMQAVAWAAAQRDLGVPPLLTHDDGRWAGEAVP
jgi:hypothetical protein